jgi:hypothetical protein
MALILKRDPYAISGDPYLVHHEGHVVGRIFNRLASAGAAEDATWFWGLSFDPQRWPSPPYGNAATREAAMAAFRARWDSRANAQESLINVPR